MMKKEHNVILTNRIRFARLLFCGIILCSNFISSQQSPKISSHFKDEEISFSSQSGVFIEQGTIVYDGLKEEKATSKKEKLLLSEKKSSSQSKIYATEGTYVYAEQDSLFTKIVETETSKERTIVQNIIKRQKIQCKVTEVKGTAKKSIPVKIYFNSAESSSHFTHDNQIKIIGIAVNNSYSKGKNSFLTEEENLSINVPYFSSEQNQTYTRVYVSLLSFENYFTRPPPFFL